MLLTHGRIYTMDASGSVVDTLVVRHSRIVFAGRRGDANVPGTEPVLDLGGRAVLPGLVDAHAHLTGLARARLSLDASRAGSEAEVAGAVAEAARSALPDEWITGRGWDQTRWPGGRFPSRVSLDRAAPRNPVALTRVDGHATWASSCALGLGGIDRRTPDPVGGRIVRDAAVEPTWRHCLERGPETVGDGRLVIGAVKLVADGALGSRGAALHAPYCDDPDNTGLVLLPPRSSSSGRDRRPSGGSRSASTRSAIARTRSPWTRSSGSWAPGHRRTTGSASSTRRSWPSRTSRGSRGSACCRACRRPTARPTCAGRRSDWARSDCGAPMPGARSSGPASSSPGARIFPWRARTPSTGSTRP